MAKTPSDAFHILKLDATDYSTPQFDATLCPSWEPLWLFHNWAKIIVLDFFGHWSDRRMLGLTKCNVGFTEYGFCKVCLTSKPFRINESKCTEQMLQIRFPTKVSTAVVLSTRCWRWPLFSQCPFFKLRFHSIFYIIFFVTFHFLWWHVIHFLWVQTIFHQRSWQRAKCRSRILNFIRNWEENKSFHFLPFSRNPLHPRFIAPLVTSQISL